MDAAATLANSDARAAIINSPAAAAGRAASLTPAPPSAQRPKTEAAESTPLTDEALILTPSSRSSWTTPLETNTATMLPSSSTKQPASSSLDSLLLPHLLSDFWPSPSRSTAGSNRVSSPSSPWAFHALASATAPAAPAAAVEPSSPSALASSHLDSPQHHHHSCCLATSSIQQELSVEPSQFTQMMATLHLLTESSKESSNRQQNQQQQQQEQQLDQSHHQHWQNSLSQYSESWQIDSKCCDSSSNHPQCAFDESSDTVLPHSSSAAATTAEAAAAAAGNCCSGCSPCKLFPRHQYEYNYNNDTRPASPDDTEDDFVVMSPANLFSQTSPPVLTSVWTTTTAAVNNNPPAPPSPVSSLTSSTATSSFENTAVFYPSYPYFNQMPQSPQSNSSSTLLPTKNSFNKQQLNNHQQFQPADDDAPPHWVLSNEPSYYDAALCQQQQPYQSAAAVVTPGSVSTPTHAHEASVLSSHFPSPLAQQFANSKPSTTIAAAAASPPSPDQWRPPWSPKSPTATGSGAHCYNSAFRSSNSNLNFSPVAHEMQPFAAGSGVSVDEPRLKLRLTRRQHNNRGANNRAAAANAAVCDGGPTYWGMWEDERSRMIYVSWLPRSARANDRTEKKRCELVLKDFIQIVLGFHGLEKVLLFPPTSAHCKLLFVNEDAAKAFLGVFGGLDEGPGPTLWKILVCRHFRVDIRDGIYCTKVRIIWADQTKNDAEGLCVRLPLSLPMDMSQSTALHCNAITGDSAAQ